MYGQYFVYMMVTGYFLFTKHLLLIIAYYVLEGCIGFGPNANLAGAKGFTFAAGGSGRSENFEEDPQGTVGFDV